MKLFLDLDRFSKTTQGYGGVGALEREWIRRYAEAPDRSTLYAWTKNSSFTSSFENYLKLCACLGVDPAYLLDTEKLRATSFAEEVLWKVVASLGGRGVAANDLFEMFGFRPDWPNNARVSPIYGHIWQRRFFENPGSPTGHYQSIKLATYSPMQPVVFHFAFQLPDSKMWRMYGYIVMDKQKNDLVHFFGRNGSEPASQTGTAIVQTHFGNGKTRFCVASLCDFDVKLVENSACQLPLCFNI